MQCFTCANIKFLPALSFSVQTLENVLMQVHKVLQERPQGCSLVKATRTLYIICVTKFL